MDHSEKSHVLVARDLRKSFRRESGEIVHALDGVSFKAAYGTLTALVGPDGAGKTTLVRLAAGLMAPDSGGLRVLDFDVAAEPQRVQDRIGYMPQRFGLYEDLSVQENLDLYADLHGVSVEERSRRYPRLMEMTALGSFTGRLAGRLSGGMKQKLGLACTLVRAPELLLLDEPTVGVDPLSRRELWDIILQLVGDQGLTVLLSTSYLDEAERCGLVIVMHEGHVLAHGNPAEVTALAARRVFRAEPPTGQKAREFQARLLDQPDVIDAVPDGGRVRFVMAEMRDESEKPDQENDDPSRLSFYGVTAARAEPRFEDGFMMLLRRSLSGSSPGSVSSSANPPFYVSASPPDQVPSSQGSSGPLPPAQPAVVEVRDLSRRFGDFTAVDSVSFEVRRGEIYGLLGPNGAGKTTTFRMLCGLLPASSGRLRVAGADLRRARATARQRIGYVAQKFSLYGQLSVRENLDFFASAYNLRGAQKTQRIAWALEQFELTPLVHLPSGNLPGGFKQRLAMAAALLHQPETLFLDEPTSGADPVARREFWRRITALSEQGVTVVITTHFMEEAEYCDRVAILDAGRILAQGTPAEIRSRAATDTVPAPDMEDAFIAVVEAARAHDKERGAA